MRIIKIEETDETGKVVKKYLNIVLFNTTIFCWENPIEDIVAEFLRLLDPDQVKVEGKVISIRIADKIWQDINLETMEHSQSKEGEGDEDSDGAQNGRLSSKEGKESKSPGKGSGQDQGNEKGKSEGTGPGGKNKSTLEVTMQLGKLMDCLEKGLYFQ